MTATNILILAMGQDTAGQGVRIKQAFDRHVPDRVVRAVHSTPTYMRYPTDLAFDRRRVLKLYEAADVVHLRNTLDGYVAFDQGRRKPVILHHHGSLFRTRHRTIAAGARRIGAVQFVSTIDLILLEPGLRWLPAPYNLPALEAIRAEQYRDDGKIRIAHAPTNRAIKGTDHFLAIVDRLAQKYPVEAVLIERQPWSKCLQAKARADIYYDQLILGYGCNAIEAWGMGIPVVAGAEDPRVRLRMVKEWGTLPFVQTTPASLERRLEELVRSEALRREWGEIGRAHARAYHDDAHVAAILAEAYDSAPRTTGATIGLARRGTAGRRERGSRVPA